MRTTITFPDDLHAVLTSIAQDRRQTISQTVEELVRRGLDGSRPYRVVASPRTGLLGVELGRPITLDDVRSLEDDM